MCAANLQESFDRLLDLIATAASRLGDEYFQLPVADADAVYRERLYCYELYHQLRSMWDMVEFSLGGEIDKHGNPHFRDGPYARAVPDLLVHRPSDMDRNLAIVEVKSVNGLGGAADDLQKLQWFCDNASYFRGIFLAYGDAGEIRQLDRRVRDAGNRVGADLGRIKCLYHRRIGNRAELVWP